MRVSRVIVPITIVRVARKVTQGVTSAIVFREIKQWHPINSLLWLIRKIMSQLPNGYPISLRCSEQIHAIRNSGVPDMQVLMITLGSVGDLLPLLSIARALRSRGHEVSIAGSNTFAPHVRRLDFEFNTVLDSDRVQRPTEDARLWDLNRIWAMGWERVLAPAMRPTYELIGEKSKERPCVVLAHWVVFGARLAAEKLAVPYGTIYMSPEVLNACDTTGVHGPRWRTFSEDEVFGPLLNAYRRELGLEPVDHIASQW